MREIARRRWPPGWTPLHYPAGDRRDADLMLRLGAMRWYRPGWRFRYVLACVRRDLDELGRP